MDELKLSSRLSRMFAVTALILFTLIGTGVYFVMQEASRNQLRAALEVRVNLARLIVDHSTDAAHWERISERLNALSPQHNDPLVYVTSTDPRFQYGLPIVGERVRASDPRYVLIHPPGREFALLTKTVVIPAKEDRPALTMVVAEDRAETQRSMRVLVLTLIGLTTLASIGILILSGAVARYGLKPLTQLSSEAAALTHTNREQRLRADNLPPELRELAVSFNGALERLEHAYQQLDSFNADVAHELRTPVGIMIGQTEVALSQFVQLGRQSAKPLEETLHSNLEELQRMRMIINDMLFISRAERGERVCQTQSLGLAAEVEHTLHFLDMPFEDAGVHVVLEGQADAMINRTLFGRALTNLLLNAVQHAARGSTVTVTLSNKQNHAEVAVSNAGEPIPPTERDKIFERFYRLDAARANSQTSHGLGLAIVRAIANMHNGEVFLRCAQGINTFGFTVSDTLR